MPTHQPQSQPNRTCPQFPQTCNCCRSRWIREVLISLGQFKSITVESSYPTSGLDRAVACQPCSSASPERWLSQFDRASTLSTASPFLRYTELGRRRLLGLEKTRKKERESLAAIVGWPRVRVGCWIGLKPEAFGGQRSIDNTSALPCDASCCRRAQPRPPPAHLQNEQNNCQSLLQHLVVHEHLQHLVDIQKSLQFMFSFRYGLDLHFLPIRCFPCMDADIETRLQQSAYLVCRIPPAHSPNPDKLYIAREPSLSHLQST